MRRAQMGPVHDDRFHGDHHRFRASDNTLFRRLAGALAGGRWLSMALGRRVGAAAWHRGPAPAPGLQRQDRVFLLAPDPHPLDLPPLPLRPGHGHGLESPHPLEPAQHCRDRDRDGVAEMIKALGYFLEIIKGGLITARHFFTNMWFHTLKVLGLKARRRGAVTIQYPEQKKDLAARHRSLHRLMRRDDGKT